MRIFAFRFLLFHKQIPTVSIGCYLYEVTSRRQKTGGYGGIKRLSTETEACYKILSFEVIGIIKLCCICAATVYSFKISPEQLWNNSLELLEAWSYLKICGFSLNQVSVTFAVLVTVGEPSVRFIRNKNKVWKPSLSNVFFLI